jgi:aryl-alcohol dehydrogenase-like predicted oxidoreductase
MEMRTIGSLNVSVVGLGTNNFGFRLQADEVKPVIDAALDAGINLFDTSDSYADSEPRIAAALADGNRRDRVVLATKFGTALGPDTPGGASREYIRAAVERSLTRLRTDRIDLYQIHQPHPETPIAETLGALDELVREGKVREIGCSNFSAEQLDEAATAAGTAGGARFVSVQNHFNLLHRDDESTVIPACERLGLAYVPYFPLASGLLTGKYERGTPPPEGTRLSAWGPRAEQLLADANFDAVDRLTAWAADHGHSLLDLAFAWLLATPTVASVIAGATKPEQARANAATAGWTLTPAARAEVDALLAG